LDFKDVRDFLWNNYCGTINAVLYDYQALAKEEKHKCKKISY
jgi:hypothetical protein